jgi:hypothetical protein
VISGFAIILNLPPTWVACGFFRKSHRIRSKKFDIAFPLDNRTFPESILLSCDHILQVFFWKIKDSWTAAISCIMYQTRSNLMYEWNINFPKQKMPLIHISIVIKITSQSRLSNQIISIEYKLMSVNFDGIFEVCEVAGFLT